MCGAKSRARPLRCYRSPLQNVSKSWVDCSRLTSTHEDLALPRIPPEIEPIHPKAARHRQFAFRRPSDSIPGASTPAVARTAKLGHLQVLYCGPVRVS
jgi:hypothetical protein